MDPRPGSFTPPLPFVSFLVPFSLEAAPPACLVTFPSPPSSLAPSVSLLRSPLVVFDSSKAGSRRANSRCTHSNTQLCHLLQSHDWDANPHERHDAPSYLTHWSITSKEQDRGRESEGNRNETVGMKGNGNQSQTETNMAEYILMLWFVIVASTL